MSFLNVEIKARHRDIDRVRSYLVQHNANFRGTDLQVDTYFNVANGRLKLREGNIENNLIYYKRDNQAGPKSSHFHLMKVSDAAGLKEILSQSNGIKIIVEKKREIYFIDNVKFHIDEVPGLGNFIEIEASNKGYDLTQEELQAQCNFYIKELQVEDVLLLSESYSDLLMRL
ncbi:MAG: class IV adenylate cyclase [Chitinophagaceae bacterium]|nr:class IV adenylate cyclase [Chitinophagaceae bacterium]